MAVDTLAQAMYPLDIDVTNYMNQPGSLTLPIAYIYRNFTEEFELIDGKQPIPSVDIRLYGTKVPLLVNSHSPFL